MSSIIASCAFFCFVLASVSSSVASVEPIVDASYTVNAVAPTNNKPEKSPSSALATALATFHAVCITVPPLVTELLYTSATVAALVAIFFFNCHSTDCFCSKFCIVCRPLPMLIKAISFCCICCVSSSDAPNSAMMPVPTCTTAFKPWNTPTTWSIAAVSDAILEISCLKSPIKSYISAVCCFASAN